MAAVGTVAHFDEHKGLGTVRADDGRELPFHCTSIADGSRTVETGARVNFSVVAGHLGRWEAADLAEVGP
ncbi:MAG TPA: cold shock domain-containing protein [Acidimicrobiales bacterium]|nr:cold shock domain-containing protein [Acidimicrobiales bacterium]